MMTTPQIIQIVSSSLAILLAFITLIVWGARLAPALEHLANAVSRLSEKGDNHETRISHLEGWRESGEKRQMAPRGRRRDDPNGGD